jgi:hypothetical protein
MLFLLQTYAKKTAPENRYFRWHDSGDLQSIKHFNDICWIAEKTPDIQHWLPTRETRIVDAYIGNIPNNLTIRYTATMLDTLVKPTCFTHIAGVTTEKDSAVVQEQANTIGVNLHFCKAYLTEGKCDNCRACWDKKVQAVVYLKH